MFQHNKGSNILKKEISVNERSSVFLTRTKMKYIKKERIFNKNINKIHMNTEHAYKKLNKRYVMTYFLWSFPFQPTPIQLSIEINSSQNIIFSKKTETI